MSIPHFRGLQCQHPDKLQKHPLLDGYGGLIGRPRRDGIYVSFVLALQLQEARVAPHSVFTLVQGGDMGGDHLLRAAVEEAVAEMSHPGEVADVGEVLRLQAHGPQDASGRTVSQ